MFRILRHRSIAVVVAVGTVLVVAVDLTVIGVSKSYTPAAVASVESLLVTTHSVTPTVQCSIAWHCAPRQINQLVFGGLVPVPLHCVAAVAVLR